MRALGADAMAVAADVQRREEIEKVRDAIVAQWGPVDILVNAPGVNATTPIFDISEDEWETILSTNLKSVFLACQIFGRVMIERGGGGSIINMSSTASHLGYPVFFAYSAAKGAVRSMTKSIAVHCQMKRYNIRCNSIHASSIDTPMIAQALAEMGAKPPADDDPIGVGKPEDVANLVLFLASDESQYINGAEHMIDNALTVQ